MCVGGLKPTNLLSTNVHTFATGFIHSKTNIKTHTKYSGFYFLVSRRRYIDILYCFCIKQNHASFSSIHHIIITSHNPSHRKRFSSFISLSLFRSSRDSSTTYAKHCIEMLSEKGKELPKTKQYLPRSSNGMGICGNTTITLTIAGIFSFRVWIEKYYQPSNERRHWRWRVKYGRIQMWWCWVADDKKWTPT